MRSSLVTAGGTTGHVRIATAPGDADRLQRTASILRRVSHPGVVEVVGSDAGRLATRWVGPEIGVVGAGGLPACVVAGLGAAAATTLADLHSLGWCHGAVAGEHLLVPEGDGPVWCGFGAATMDTAGAPDDVRALAGVLQGLLVADGDRVGSKLVRAALADAARGRLDASGLARRLTDRRIAARLPFGASASGPPDVASLGASAATGDAVVTDRSNMDAEAEVAAEASLRDDPPGATAPRPRPSGGAAKEVAATSHRRAAARRRRHVTVLLLPALLVGLVALLLVEPGRSAASGGSGVAAQARVAAHARVAASGRSTAAACPPVDAGCRPVATPGGVLVAEGRRVAVAHRGQPVVLGRWGCGPVALPALLDPDAGRVWVWDRWAAPGADVAARTVGQVPGASTLEVDPGADGCDRVVVVRTGAHPVVLDPRAAP